MPAPIRPVDELGFPIPAKFEPLPGGGDEPRPPRRSIFHRLGRWRWLLLLLVPALLFGRQLVDLGREVVATIQFHRAQDDVGEGNLQKALAHAGRAIAWEPDPGRRAEVLFFRGQVHEKLYHLGDSMRDYDEAIRLLNDANPLRKPSDELAVLYRQRAFLHQRLAQPRDALVDCTFALECSPRGNFGRYPTLYANLLNERAYISALSGLELKTGLDDVGKALRELGEDKPALLDTRACVRYRLGQYATALHDMNVALDQVELRRSSIRLGGDRDQIRAPQEELDEMTDQNLAVMYHHRGEIYRRLGEDPKDKDHADYQQKAEADFQSAARLGFDPQGGEALEAAATAESTGKS